MCLRFQYCTHQRVCVLNFLKKSQIRCTLMCIPVTHICVEMLPRLVTVLCVANKTCNRVGRQNPQKAAASVRVKVPHLYGLKSSSNVVTEETKLFPMFKGTVSRDFRLLVFFMSQFSPSPQVYHQGRFEFLAKIRNGPNGILCGWGELIHEKTRSKKSRETVPLRAHTWSM